MIQIKEFSKQTDFSVRMLRYLEEMELLIPTRGENNYRYYNKSQLQVAKQIKTLQDLGFQLKEVKSLKNTNHNDQIEILEKILQREIEIAELKSDSIPKLRQLIEVISNSGGLIEDHLSSSSTKKMTTMGGDPKFHRTAYSIPTLRTVYEDHLTQKSGIKLIATDLMKFSQYLEEVSYIPEVYSIIKESSFIFGQNLSSDFISAYKESWKGFLKNFDMKKLNSFSKQDVSQLMGVHDIVIRTSFEYSDGTSSGEIVIPYAPFYYLTT